MKRGGRITNELLEALKKKSNRGLLVYLLVNFIVIWLLLGQLLSYALIGNLLLSLGLGMESTITQIILLIFSLALTGCIYYLSLLTSLTKFGEWIIRKQLRAKEIVKKKDKERLYPLYNEVYERVVAKYPQVSKDIKLFITYDETPNACAAGQNTIILTTGLLSLSDEQIKGILAHEFAHIVNKDTTLLLITQAGNIIFNLYALWIGIGLTVLEIAWSDDDGRPNIITLMIRFIFLGIFQLILKGVYLLALKSSRDNEYEADKFAARIGYGQPLIDSLELIAKEHYARGVMENLNSTHPETDNRIATIENELELCQIA